MSLKNERNNVVTQSRTSRENGVHVLRKKDELDIFVILLVGCIRDSEQTSHGRIGSIFGAIINLTCSIVSVE